MTEGEDGRSASRLIALNSTLRAECERQLPVINRMAEPATSDEIMAILVREAPTYGVLAKHGAEWAALFGAYLDALEGMPAAAIEEGFIRWNRGEGHKDLAMGGFYPKPAQLYQLAEIGRRALKMAAYRARLAMEHVEKKGLEWTPERKAEEKRRAIEMGILKPDGSINFEIKTRTMAEVETRPTRSPQAVAEELRRAAASEVGDVI